MRRVSLPLGIDIGATRVRVLQAIATPQGPRVKAVAVRNVIDGTSSSGLVDDPLHVAALLKDALAELDTRERRCILAIGEPDALVRPLALPKMTSAERESTARFEAQRLIDFSVSEAIVRVHRGSANGTWILGVARARAVQTRLAAVRGAGLRAVAADHESCALARALPAFDAVVDVGHRRACIHLACAGAPSTLQTSSGGAAITWGIRRELSIDEHTAEKRKRILGTSGAGERARVSLTAEIASLLTAGRRIRTIDRVAIVGNASRLPGLASELEAATGARFETPVADVLRAEEYPEDVVRAGAPDWTLAAGLSLWSGR